MPNLSFLCVETAEIQITLVTTKRTDCLDEEASSYQILDF